MTEPTEEEMEQAGWIVDSASHSLGYSGHELRERIATALHAHAEAVRDERARAAAIETRAREVLRTGEETERELAEARRERDDLQRWVHDLQAAMYINCVYCGHRYGPDDEVPATMADALKAHIEECPKHPMSALKKKLAALEADLEEWRTGAHADETGHLHRCARINGVWSCVTGCLAPRVAALEADLAAMREALEHVLDVHTIVYVGPEAKAALVDLVYVIVGAALEYGFDIAGAFVAVHAANMAKLGPDGKPVMREDGKVLKPEGWRPADLTPFAAIRAGATGGELDERISWWRDRWTAECKRVAALEVDLAATRGALERGLADPGILGLHVDEDDCAACRIRTMLRAALASSPGAAPRAPDWGGLHEFQTVEAMPAAWLATAREVVGALKEEHSPTHACRLNVCVTCALLARPEVKAWAG